MIVAGLGFRRGVTLEGLSAALALVAEVVGSAVVEALATAEDKAGEPGLHQLVAETGLPLHVVPQALLVAQRVEGSARVKALYGTGSVAEASALAAAGPCARLLVPKLIGPDGRVVVAVAESAR